MSRGVEGLSDKNFWSHCGLSQNGYGGLACLARPVCTRLVTAVQRCYADEVYVFPKSPEKKSVASACALCTQLLCT